MKVIIEQGNINPNIKDLSPFFCLVRTGGSYKATRVPKNNKIGQYTFGNTSNGGFLYKTGLIMPILSLEPEIKEKIEKVFEFVKTLPTSNQVAYSRSTLQKFIDEIGLGFLRLTSETQLNGWFEFKLDKKLFETFIQELSYVTKIELDNKEFSISELKKFSWKSYGELLEWFYGYLGDEFYTAQPILFYLVNNNVDGNVYSHFSKYKTSPYYEYSKLDLVNFFDLKKEIKTSSLEVYFEKTQGGWSLMRMTIDNVVYKVILSNAFDPISSLLSFVRCVDIGDLPFSIVIDEEGSDKKLEAYLIGEQNKFVFVMSECYDDENNEPIVQAVFDKDNFVATFVKAFKDFFDNRYDASEWEWYSDEDSTPLKDLVFNDEWFIDKL